MFDDQSNFPTPPANLPVEPDDILAPMDELKTEPAPELPNALKSGVLKPKQDTVMPQRLPDEAGSISQKPHKTLLIVGGVALFLLIGGFLLWRFLPGSKGVKVSVNNPKDGGSNSGENNPLSVPATTSVNKSNTNEVLFGDSSTTSSVPIVKNDPEFESATRSTTVDLGTAGSSLDGDHDGVANSEETKLGTDPNNPDTDGDRLSDGDEVQAWRTDPLKKDTDGDGFSDDQEILNGYSPLVPVLKITTDAISVRFVSSTPSSTSFKYVIYPIKR